MVKKLGIMAALVAVSVLSIAFLTGKVHARLVSGPGTDAFCAGAAGVEVCIDSSGNIVPTTASVGGVGTSALPWSDMRTGSLTATGTTTLSGAVNASATVTLSSAAFIGGIMFGPVISSATVPNCTTTIAGGGMKKKVTTCSSGNSTSVSVTWSPACTTGSVGTMTNVSSSTSSATMVYGTASATGTFAGTIANSAVIDVNLACY